MRTPISCSNLVAADDLIVNALALVDKTNAPAWVSDWLVQISNELHRQYIAARRNGGCAS